jgi:hypothetical protein
MIHFIIVLAIIWWVLNIVRDSSGNRAKLRAERKFENGLVSRGTWLQTAIRASEPRRADELAWHDEQDRLNAIDNRR